MSAYQVWDELNGEEEYAHAVFNACSPEEAARLYAENDRDGYTEGLYHMSAQPISVRCPDGTLKRFQVRAELEPRFIATEMGGSRRGGGGVR